MRHHDPHRATVDRFDRLTFEGIGDDRLIGGDVASGRLVV